MTDVVLAVPPSGGAVIHLRIPDYQPSRKPRSVSRDCLALCGMLLNQLQLPGVPLAQALAWIDRLPTAMDQRPQWRWCRHCIGHAAEAVGIANTVARLVARRTVPDGPAVRRRPRGVCTVCDGNHALRADGTVQGHLGNTFHQCPGVGKLPKQPAAAP